MSRIITDKKAWLLNLGLRNKMTLALQTQVYSILKKIKTNFVNNLATWRFSIILFPRNTFGELIELNTLFSQGGIKFETTSKHSATIFQKSFSWVALWIKLTFFPCEVTISNESLNAGIIITTLFLNSK